MGTTGSLTARFVATVTPAETRREYFDRVVTGLALRVAPTGTKSWVLIYRQGRRLSRWTLGRYPTLSLADARNRDSGGAVRGGHPSGTGRPRPFVRGAPDRARLEGGAQGADEGRRRSRSGERGVDDRARAVLTSVPDTRDTYRLTLDKANYARPGDLARLKPITDARGRPLAFEAVPNEPQPRPKLKQANTHAGETFRVATV